MKRIFLLAALALPLTSNAVEWVDLGKSGDKTVQVFLDYDSVKRQDVRVLGSKDSYISAIFQMTYINSNPLRKQGLYYSKQQWFISCEDSAYLINAYIDYGFKNEVKGSHQSTKSILSNSDFSYAFPETVGGEAIEQACSSILLKELDSAESYEEFLKNYIDDNQ